MTFDELRIARPALGLALYALDPGRGVTLEVYADGELFQFHGATADDAIRSAFPPALGVPAAATGKARVAAEPETVLVATRGDLAAGTPKASVFD